ncbi:hypothetical protein LM602_03385 [Candidatus Acetothermia bacterium]|jgi:hypothetical protein|nr:hypothetical protein [Candidatus Acetothermia bacterium]MCI2431586.1 hypothetical protein [Candidatus Acetothermia bacterium]MCI2436296.1 hypothetical protein [Candidatus Acetothermia bacterium]
MKIARAAVLIVLLLLLSLSAHATVTGAYKATVAPGATYEIAFVPTAPGRIRVHAEIRPLELFAELQLYRPGEAQPVAVTTGHSSVDLLAEADETTVGRPWHVVLTHTNSIALTVEIVINFHKALCFEIATEFGIDVFYEEAAGEIEGHHCDQMLRALRSLGRDLMDGLRRIKFLPPSEQFEGRFLSAERTVEMYRMTPGRAFTIVLYHELAHFVHIIKLGASLKRDWTALHRQSGSDISNYARNPVGPPNYAMTNEFEDFAVTFSVYIVNTKDLFDLGTARKENTDKPLLLEKAKVMAQVFLHYLNDRRRTYIYRMGLGFPVVPVQRASVPLKDDGLPDFSEPILWERF